MSDDRDILIRQLRRRWAKARNVAVTRGAAYLLAVAVGLAFVDLALDWPLNLPAGARVAMLLANLAVLALAAHLLLVRRLRRFSPLREALAEEAEHPDLQSLFVTHLQLDEADAPDPLAAGMIRATRRRATERARGHAFAQSIRFDALRTPLALGGAAAAALLIAALLAPGVFGTLAQRLFLPYANAAYPTDTKLDPLAADLAVRRYDPVELAVRAAGEVPDRGALLVREEGGRWERIALDRGEGATFSHTVASVAESFDYRFDVGDARTPTRRVTAVPPPRIVDASVTLDYPDYTGLLPRPASTLNIEAPAHTRVRWELTLDRPVNAAALVAADGRSVPAELSDGGRTVRASLAADASLAYRYRFEWSLNGRRHENETARRFVQVIPDLPPRVAIRYPRQSGKATLAKRLVIEFTADDDYDIADARLVYALNDGPERALGLPTATRDADPGAIDAGADGAPDHRGPRRRVEIDPASLVDDLRIGDILSYRIAVTDNRDGGGGPQCAASRLLRLQFVSRDEYLQHVTDQRARLLGQLRPIYQQERQAYGNLSNLADALSPNREDER